MAEIAIVLRYGRAVVSHRIPIPTGLGWHAAENWQALEPLAAQEVQTAKAAGHPGPFVYPCSGSLADKATWRLPGQTLQQSLFPESEAQP